MTYRIPSCGIIPAADSCDFGCGPDDPSKTTTGSSFTVVTACPVHGHINYSRAILSERETEGRLVPRTHTQRSAAGSAEQPPTRSERLADDPYQLRSALVNIEIALTATNPATTLERRIERAVEQVHKALG